MEKGERFEFGEFKFHGKLQKYPVHPEHLVLNKDRERLSALLKKAANPDKVMINANGNVGLMQWLLRGYTVRDWSQAKGVNVKVVLIPPNTRWGTVIWYI